MDIRTLAWALILVLAMVTALWAAIAAFRRDRAITYWALGMGGSAVGFFVLMIQPLVPSPVTPLVGNALVLAFTVSLPTGLACFLGERRGGRRRYTVYALVWVALMLWFTVIAPLYPVRASLTSWFTVVFTGEFLGVLGRQGQPISPFVRRMLSLVGGLYLGVHLVRAVLILGSGATSLLSDQAYTAGTLMMTLGFAVLWGGALLLLDASRLRDRAEAQTGELRRLNDLKDRVLAVTSHDLRGPLSNLHILWNDLAARLEQGRCEAMDLELMRLVDRSLTGTQSLLENLFRFAEAQRTRADPQALTDLRAVVEAVEAQWAPGAQAKGVRLEPFRGEAPLVAAETEAAITVLRNLVGNAVKFTPRGGTVTVRLFEQLDGTVGCEVSDTGIGMSADQILPTAEGPRASRPGTDGERGSGFGLMLVRELVSQWGGKLEIESAVGQGTRVRVSFLPATVLETPPPT